LAQKLLWVLALKPLVLGQLAEQRLLLLQMRWRRTLRLAVLVLAVRVLTRLKLQRSKTLPCS
jgi:hypothetical protein